MLGPFWPCREVAGVLSARSGARPAQGLGDLRAAGSLGFGGGQQGATGQRGQLHLSEPVQVLSAPPVAEDPARLCACPASAPSWEGAGGVTPRGRKAFELTLHSPEGR